MSDQQQGGAGDGGVNSLLARLNMDNGGSSSNSKANDDDSSKKNDNVAPSADTDAAAAGLKPTAPIFQPKSAASAPAPVAASSFSVKGASSSSSSSSNATVTGGAEGGAGVGAGSTETTSSPAVAAAAHGTSSRSGSDPKPSATSDSDDEKKKKEQVHGVGAGAPSAEVAAAEEEPAGPGAATQLLKSTYEVQVTLADQQLDPNSPLFSAKKFEDLGLHPDLLKGLYAMQFSKPSKIQEKALPLLLKNPPDNMIGQSQSGTGKTAAFSLTMLTRIDYGLAKPQAICLAPSRELARQIEQVIQTMGQFVPLKTFLAVKESWNKNTIVDAQIVVGTPGTVMDMIGRRVIDAKLIKCLVLDEADEMLDFQGLGDQTMRIKKMLPPKTQIVLFSATFNDRVRAFAERFAPHANQLMLRQEELSVEGIKQFYMDCADEEAKYDVLVELYNYLTIGQSIIFCKMRATADRIAARMIEGGHAVASLHGDKDVGERDAIIDGFRNGKTKVLITTNVVARGIDIQQVNMVVNYDTPVISRGEGAGRADTDTYLHRVGRTGRFGRKGIAILFVSDEKSWQEMKELETDLGIEMIKIETRDLDGMEETLKREMKK